MYLIVLISGRPAVMGCLCCTLNMYATGSIYSQWKKGDWKLCVIDKDASLL